MIEKLQKKITAYAALAELKRLSALVRKLSRAADAEYANAANYEYKIVESPDGDTKNQQRILRPSAEGDARILRAVMPVRKLQRHIALFLLKNPIPQKQPNKSHVPKTPM